MSMFHQVASIRSAASSRVSRTNLAGTSLFCSRLRLAPGASRQSEADRIETTLV